MGNHPGSQDMAMESSSTNIRVANIEDNKKEFEAECLVSQSESTQRAPSAQMGGFDSNAHIIMAQPEGIRIYSFSPS